MVLMQYFYASIKAQRGCEAQIIILNLPLLLLYHSE